MISTRTDFRSGLLCVVISMTALLLAWPFAATPFNDDWTWALTVKQLHLTGHLVYNGWSSPSVIAQAYWGLLWVKLFGFSFNVLRISTLPMAAGCVAVTYALARRAGLNSALSIFATLTLGLSPLFMPMESSFMTDVPGLFFLLLSMYMLARGYESKSIGWILTGAMIALIGGSSRQVVWIVPLITLPYFAWLRRADRSFAVITIVAWILVFTGAVAMQHWFGKQPYAIPDPPAMSYLHQAIKHPKTQVVWMIWVGLTVMLTVLPITLAGIRRMSMQKTGIAIFIFVGLLEITHHYRRVMMPWMENIITVTGVLSSNELGGDRPVSLTHPTRYALSMLVFASTASLLEWGTVWIIRESKSSKSIFDFFLNPKADRAAVQAILITTAAYLCLELTRCVFNVGFDRHLLPLIPFVGIPILRCFQQSGMMRMPIISWAMLLMFTLYGIAITQDVNSLARARVVAIDRLKVTGITDIQIDAGFEHNYWTQADGFGHINDARLQNPPGAYDKSKGPTPDLKFVDRLERQPTSDTAATPFGQVDYFSLLPPFHRVVYIDRFVDPWWLDPAKAKTRPVPRQILPKLLIEQYK